MLKSVQPLLWLLVTGHRSRSRPCSLASSSLSRGTPSPGLGSHLTWSEPSRWPRTPSLSTAQPSSRSTPRPRRSSSPTRPPPTLRPPDLAPKMVKTTTLSTTTAPDLRGGEIRGAPSNPIRYTRLTISGCTTMLESAIRCYKWLTS